MELVAGGLICGGWWNFQKHLVNIIMNKLKLFFLNVTMGVQSKVSPGSSMKCTDASMSLVPVSSTTLNTRKAELIFTCQGMEAVNGCMKRQTLSCHSGANHKIGDANVLHSETKWALYISHTLDADIILMVSCQKGPTRHAYAWQIGPFWQDTLDM